MTDKTLLGCIADDFTGATDLANTLVKEGMRVVQLLGVPDDDFAIGDTDAIVVALKTRTIAPAQAIDQSLGALRWLQAREAKQFFFKYCSTFDSTDKGNIGPVADALLDALDTGFTIACPAFPTTGRTIYNGYLFVGGVLLSESSMKDHPLTPMRDANLVRVLGRQTSYRVGLVSHDRVAKGTDAVVAAFDDLAAEGIRHAIVDAVDDADLRVIGVALQHLTLVTGGSGVALGLADNFRRCGALGQSTAPVLPGQSGRAAVIAGSCSVATRGQLANIKPNWPTFEVDPLALAAGDDVADRALAWVDAQATEVPVAIYSSAAPDVVTGIQARLGRSESGELIERTMARIAQGLVGRGVDRLIVAGGETAGAVVSALGIEALRIGPEIDPGVPWCESLGSQRFALALKSGNFGAEDFFAKAFAMLES